MLRTTRWGWRRPGRRLHAKSIVFGDFSGYYARFAGPIRIKRSDDFAFLNDLVTFKFVMRAVGDLIDLSAVKHFLGAAF